jgi:SHS2 domain-containing protein
VGAKRKEERTHIRITKEELEELLVSLWETVALVGEISQRIQCFGDAIKIFLLERDQQLTVEQSGLIFQANAERGTEVKRDRERVGWYR